MVQDGGWCAGSEVPVAHGARRQWGGWGPDVISDNAAISACEKGRGWAQAVDLLRNMWHCRLLLSVIG